MLFKKDMNKKIMIAVLLLAILAGGIFIFRKKSSPATADKMIVLQGGTAADMIYYYGKECLHCDNVNKFMQDNLIESKIVLAKKEVLHDIANKTELADKVRECGWSEEQDGLPFIYARGKCYLGEVDVKNFLKSEANIK